MNEQDKPKEFWIDNREETLENFFLYNVKRGVMNYSFEGAIHVIEYSAYEQALEKIRQLEGRLQITNSNWPHEKALHKKIAELEEEVKRLNDKYDFQLLVKRYEKLTAQNEVMREAHIKYLNDESWIDRNRKAGWKDAHYIKSMGEMKEIARQALAKLDAIERGEG